MAPIIDRLNEVLNYIEFFKSSMTDCELLTAVQDQMDKHSVHLNTVNGYHINYLANATETYPHNYVGPITEKCQTLWTILNKLEQSCKNDITNKQQ